MISRRSILFACAAPLFADEQSEIVEWLGKFAGHLTEENPESFLRACGKELRGKLESNIRGLVQNNEIASSVAVVSVGGQGEQRELELDWYLELAPKANPVSVVRRRERLKAVLVRAKKGWSVTSLEPLSFFSPPG